MAEESQQKTVYQEITESIRSGEYFKDALNWYSLKFIQPVTHRSYFIVITTISVLFSAWSLLILKGILPMVEVLPIVTDNKDMAVYYLELHQINDPKQRASGSNIIHAVDLKEDPNTTVIRSLTGKYIQMRENYDFNKLQTDIAYIKEFSSEEEYKKYIALMKPEATDSPILRYRSHTKRLIQVDNVALIPRGPNSALPPGQHRLVAIFTATEDGPASDAEPIVWKATLDVRFSDIVFYKDKEEFSPMDFMVTNYEAQQLKAGS